MGLVFISQYIPQSDWWAYLDWAKYAHVSNNTNNELIIELQYITIYEQSCVVMWLLFIDCLIDFSCVSSCP